jgi:serine phosphatase RsbU (regulator of sigma subunit)/PAS domain-containing protein
VIVAGRDDDMLRLITVIDHQRRELDRIRASVAQESVVAMARGALMERLGLSSSEAAAQLAELSAATAIPLADMAAAVLAEPVSGAVPANQPGTSPAITARSAPLLAEAAAELSADGTELAGTLAAQIIDPLGAAAVVVWLLGVDGTLVLLGEQGLSRGEAGHWRHVPPQLDCPAQRVAHGAADLWWSEGRPDSDPAPAAGDPDGARAVLALRERSGELLGVMEVSWPGSMAFTAKVRQHLYSLAAGCARVIAARLAHGDLVAAHPKGAVYTLLDELAESVLVVRGIRDADGELADFSIEHVSPAFRDPAARADTDTDLTRLTLLEAYPVSVTGSGLFARARQVLADGVSQYVPGPLRESLASGLPVNEAESADPALADLRVARFFDGVIFTWHRDYSADGIAAVLDHAQRLGRLGGWEENLVTGTVRWTDSAFGLFGLTPRPGAEIPLADLHSYVMAADKPVVKRFRQRLPEQRDVLTATFRVVHPDDRSIRQIRVFAEPVTDAAGAVVALRGAFQDISAHYHTQVALAATRDQLADSEQRVAEEHLLALRLQQAIMPPDEQPVEAAGIDVAVRYRPVGDGHLVGGDWYDTLLMPSQDVLLVVGDVAGHGIDAVTGMVAARNSLRGLAITGSGPAELLRMLNGVMCDLTSGVVGTVVCGLYSPDTSVLRWARAGHLPPVLVRGRTACELPLPGGVLLGMDPDATYEEATQSLEPGDTLLLFTDGLIEQRGESIVDVLREFVATVAPVPAGQEGSEPTAAAQADRILATAVSDTDDDACLVAVRIR